MRLAAIRVGTERAIGMVTADHNSVQVLDPAVGTVDDVVRGIVDLAQIASQAERTTPVPILTVRLDAPLRRFNRDVLCTGWNYPDHFHESFGKRQGQDPAALPEHPTFFTKGPDTVIGPHDPIAYDGMLSAQWDYEAEIAVVIGRDGRDIDETDAQQYIFGYLLANDVSQRDLQRAHGGQWLKGKSIDATMPIGPWITTADEVDDSRSIDLAGELNGQTMQQAMAADMAFSIARLVAELSRGMTLRAGDLILTGTPSGIGHAREPAIYLEPGDLLVTRSKTLGQLSNLVGSAHPSSPRQDPQPL